jgi:Pectate lyase superfamily protein
MVTRIVGVSRRRLMTSGICAGALFGISACVTNDSETADSSTSKIEDYIQCSPPPDQPTIDYAVVTDPTFAGGADPHENRDSSAAIRAAVASGKPVYIPPGAYIFRGPGIDHRAPFIVGAGQGATTVGLGPDTTFIDSKQLWASLTLRGIRFNGGKGHVRNRFDSANVTDYHVVSDCAFINYSGASISNNSVDQPYWKIERNIFRANNFATSMGIALSGFTDGSTIANNAFLANRVHIKLARGGNNTYIQNCDFLRFGPPQGFPRIDVWFTLSPDDVNCGTGMVLTRCKFGNENLDEQDYRIVYADESVGGTNDERWPRLDVDSPNWIGGHTVSNVADIGIGDSAPIPLIRSMTPNIVGSIYGPVTQTGNSGAPILSATQPLWNGGQSNHFGPLLRANSATSPPPELVVYAGPR